MKMALVWQLSWVSRIFKLHVKRGFENSDFDENGECGENGENLPGGESESLDEFSLVPRHGVCMSRSYRIHVLQFTRAGLK